MGPTKLVLAVVAAVVVAVVAAIVAAVFQRHVVPGAIPYGLNVHVGGTEPRVLDGRCSVSIQEWFFEVALVSRNIFQSFKSVYAFRDRFGFVNGLKQMQVRLLRMKQTGTFDDYIHALSSSTSQVKYMDDRKHALVFTSGFASDLRKEVFKEYPKKLRTAKGLAREAYGTVHRLSSLGTQTMANNEKNEQVPASTPTGSDASNSLKNRTCSDNTKSRKIFEKVWLVGRAVFCLSKAILCRQLSFGSYSAHFLGFKLDSAQLKVRAQSYL